MGLASSTARIFFFINRNNDIGRELSILSNQKMSLTRDMQHVAREYNNALTQKVYKWSNNGGVDYVDLSYNGLTKPSSSNKNKPYLITDSSERIVIDENFRKYAEMLSPDGAPAQWDGDKRIEILSSITGLSKDKISNYDTYNSNVLKAQKEILDLGAAPKNPAEKLSTYEEFIGKLGSNSFGGEFENCKDWSGAYRGGTIKVNDANGLKNIIDGIKNGLKGYFSDEDAAIFTKACDDYKNYSVEASFKGEDTNSPLVKYEDNKYYVNAKMLVDNIFETYFAAGGSKKDDKIAWVDKSGGAYNEWINTKNEYDTNYKNAQDNYNNAMSAKNALFTAEEEAMLVFYDEMFSAIAEKGWVYNNQVNDEDYLNQVLQNNLYTITTVTRSSSTDENGDTKYSNSYNTTIASNVENIVKVSDNEIREKALSEYEYKKSIITAKENKLDLKMQDLETEQSSIKVMIESIEKQAQDNTENTMKTFA